MTVEEAVFARLQTMTPVTDLVGARIYQLVFPQSTTWPAVRISLIGETEHYTVAGSNGVFRGRVQVDAVATDTSGVDTYAAARALADAINGDGLGASATGLSGWRGEVGSPPYEVKGIFRLDRSVRRDEEELQLVRVRQDYEVWGELA